MPKCLAVGKVKELASRGVSSAEFANPACEHQEQLDTMDGENNIGWGQSLLSAVSLTSQKQIF